MQHTGQGDITAPLRLACDLAGNAGHGVRLADDFVLAHRLGRWISKHDQAAGYSAYSYAYLLFQMPYAVVGISVISAPSLAAAVGRNSTVCPGAPNASLTATTSKCAASGNR